MMKNPIWNLFLTVLTFTVLSAIVNLERLVVSAQTPVSIIPVTPASSSPTSTPYLSTITPVNIQPNPTSFPYPTYSGPTIGIDPNATPVVQPTWIFGSTPVVQPTWIFGSTPVAQPTWIFGSTPVAQPTWIFGSTPVAGPTYTFMPTQIPVTPTAQPTLAVYYPPTATPTPVTYWYSFGPKGTPSDKWNTTDKLFRILLSKGIYTKFIHWWSGGWDDSIFVKTGSNPDTYYTINNSPINSGAGYFIQLTPSDFNIFKKIMDGYQNLDSFSYHLYSGWNLISIPENLTKNINPQTVEGLCKTLITKGVNLTEVDTNESNQATFIWNKHVCGQQGNNAPLKAGNAYFLRLTGGSSFTLESGKK